MANIIIVESKNDQHFISAFVEFLKIKNVEVDSPICIETSDFICLDGVDPDPLKPTNLIRKLKDVKTEILKKDIQKIGIILDIDHNPVSQRIKMINEAISVAFNDVKRIERIETISSFKKIIDEKWELQISCFFTGLDGNGELENILRGIASKPSHHADCLNSWKECLRVKGITITEKDYNKFWIANYIRFDTCSLKESRQAGKYCSMQNFEQVLKKDIFNFESELLNDMKLFLESFISTVLT